MNRIAEIMKARRCSYTEAQKLAQCDDPAPAAAPSAAMAEAWRQDAPSSALGLAVAAWNRKAPREDLRLEIAAILHADSVAELADNLEYIAGRLRETGWTAGSGGGKHSKLVWEMFCKPNRKALRPCAMNAPTSDSANPQGSQQRMVSCRSCVYWESSDEDGRFVPRMMARHGRCALHMERTEAADYCCKAKAANAKILP